MIFLNSVFLWGLLALAIPVIIHLLNFRQPKRVAFSNVAFLKEIQQVNRRSSTLKQWLILLMRMLAIACIVFAFANPMLKKSDSNALNNANKATDNRSVVFLLDNSMSMQAQDELGTWLQQAKEKVQALMKSEIVGDEYALLTVDNAAYSQSFIRSEKITERLPSLKLTAHRKTLQELIQRSHTLFSNARYNRKEVYVLSDFQKSTFGDSTQATGFATIPTYFVPIGKGLPANLALGNIQLLTQIIELSKPISLKTEIKNFSDKALSNQVLTLQVDGKTLASHSFSIAAQTSQEVGFNFTLKESGWHEGVLSLNDYPITFDNQRFFSFYIPEGKKLLILKGNNENTDYLRIAFESMQSKKAFQLDIRNESEAATLKLEQYDGIFLAGLHNIPSGMIQNFKNYVATGRGIAFFPSKEGNINDYNAFAAQLGGGVFSPIQTTVQKFQEFDIQHPLFTNVFEKDKQGRIESPDIKTSMSYRPTTQSVHSLVISLRNGQSFLSEVQTKNGSTKGGKVYYCAVYPSLLWSDFPIHNTFVPIIYRTALSIAGSTQYDGFHFVGDNVSLTIRTTDLKSPITLSKEKIEIVPAQEPSQNGILLNIQDNLTQAGNYNIVQNKQTLRKISFNYDDKESNLKHYEATELENLVATQHWKNTTVLKGTAKQLAQAFKDARVGKPLWRWFVVFALLFLGIEMFLLKFYRTKTVV